MQINYGNSKTEYGLGVSIQLTGDEVATAIDNYLTQCGVKIRGPRTVMVNGELCEEGSVYVDPSGCVHDNKNSVTFSGRGPKI